MPDKANAPISDAQTKRAAFSRRFFLKVIAGLVAFIPSAHSLVQNTLNASAASLRPLYVFCSEVFCRVWTTYCFCGTRYCVFYCLDVRTEEECGYITEECGTC
jgi:hypothetical protein